MKRFTAFVAVFWLLLTLPAFAQTSTPAEERQDIFGAGGSYNSAPTAVPSFAGSIVYAHRIQPGLYSFTLIDVFAQPTTVTDAEGVTTSKYQITTTPTTGLAQYLREIGRVKIYVIGTVGAAAGGTQIGWAYSTGGAAYIGLGKGWCLMPNLRMMKSSLSGDYQGIYGIMIGWGK